MNIATDIKNEIKSELESRCCRDAVENAGTGLFECCKKAVVIHCFITGGSLTVYEKGGYSLEFNAGEFKNVLLGVFSEISIRVGEGKRGLYMKGRDAICDCLALMGANKAVLRLNDLIAERDYKREIARKVNCDDANADRIVAASVVQCEVIEELMKRGVIKDERLLEVAIVRLNFREDSYEELSEKLGISKSTVRYRLGKLMGMTEDL